MISKEICRSLIEPHFHKDLDQESYSIEKVPVQQLLTHTRFDLAFKLFYLYMQDKNKKLATKVYKAHIKAFSLGKFTEPGNREKNSFEKFIEVFEKIFQSIQTEGFDKSKSLIPLSKNGAIVNGAHRVASAIYLNKDVYTVQLNTHDQIYDYRFFYQRDVPSPLLDIAANTFTMFADNVYIAFLWPIGIQKEYDIEAIIPNIVYKKEIKLTPNGAHNLLTQIYFEEEWLGSVENNFNGVNNKLVECFKTFDAFNVVAFQASSLDEVLQIKEQIRQLFQVGKHSVHITDTKEEAQRVARLVFNENGIHFLNHAKPNHFLSTSRKIEQFKTFLKENNINSEDIVIDSSFVLACYGLREAEDIDYLTYKKISKPFTDINPHDEELKYYRYEKEDLIYDPQNYFYFNDIKFLSFDRVYAMKKKRGEIKDKNDCYMMESLIENNHLKKFKSQVKQKLFYFKIKSKRNIVDFLRKVGLFNMVRTVYRMIKR